QLERLIEDLLYVSKIEAREARLRHERVPVAAVARAAVDELQSAHPGRAVEVDVPPDLTWVLDEAKMRMVLRHLVDNALKYSDAPAPVVVRAWLDEEADRLRIDVVDRGAGIISSDIPHIFERFRQIDSSSTRRHGGTGVGLYLCLRLVRAHEGRIWVESAWGKGSTFSIALPPAVAPPERSAAASA
ncbi:MAG TPA: ATP-binding protein, partial [Actinomycetota bacterium]|nr:ATP-binding protein [Actinomycetota bacterium]